jgi:hypothetical protein
VCNVALLQAAHFHLINSLFLLGISWGTSGLSAVKFFLYSNVSLGSVKTYESQFNVPSFSVEFHLSQVDNSSVKFTQSKSLNRGHAIA